ncbi:MAG: zf-HC2 domain-containing protein [Mycobacteriales bacterium]
MSCPGDLLSGLVDGELDHATRERVHSHLLECTPCRREVEVLRALKLQLSWASVETPVPPDELTARLMAMVVPGLDPSARKPPVRVRPATGRPAGRPDDRVGPGRPSRLRLRRRATSGALLAAGLTAAFVLGGPASARPTQVPVDPASDSFIADFVSTTVDASHPSVVDATVVGSTP